MLFEYSCLQNNGQKTKFLYESPKTPAMEATNSERVYDPELFGLSLVPQPQTTSIISAIY